jgi:DNA-binding transcriptional regulator PaaX
MKKGDIIKDILSATAIGGGIVLHLADAVLTLAGSVPEPFKLYVQKNKRRRSYYIKSRALKLVDEGCLSLENRNDKKVLRITKKGEDRLKKYQVFENSKKKQKWDHKWRLVFYDVWEFQKTKRDAFRNQLKDFGFKQLQRSVWIYPYDCEDFISLLKADKKFGNNVRYFVAEKMTDDYSLRKMFGFK